MQHTNDNFFPEEYLLDAVIMRSHVSNVASPGIIMGNIPEEPNQCRANKHEQYATDNDKILIAA
eukprot:4520012-Ditylum_brightwellii.AAC.1